MRLRICFLAIFSQKKQIKRSEFDGISFLMSLKYLITIHGNEG